MAVETAADRLALLADFGECVKYTFASGKVKSVKVIFDNSYYQQEAGGTVGFAVRDPRIVGRTCDLTGAAEGDSVVIGDDTYTTRIVMPDGTGMTEIQLELV